jgi:hypothetical protein
MNVATHIWLGSEHDITVTLTGAEWPDEATGRLYVQVVDAATGVTSAAPEDELVSIAKVRTVRHRYWNNGFRVVAVRNRSKAPAGVDWVNKALCDPPAVIAEPPDPNALGTGILCGDVAALDIDIFDQTIVDQLVHFTETLVGVSPLVRVGQAPKTMLLCRAGFDFGRLLTAEYVLEGRKAQVELRGKGHHVVADGLHPDTGKPFVWLNGTPANTRLADLPEITEAHAKAILAEGERLIRAAGGEPKKKPQSTTGGNGRDKHPPGDSFLNNVNTAALADLGNWVPALYPSANYQPTTGAYRVAAKDRSRPDLQEDISFHADGIRDFGLERGLTPIDAVIEHGGAADAVAAAHWLCERLGIEPAALGWSKGRGQHQGNGAENEPPADWETQHPPQEEEAPAWPEPIGIFGDLIGAPTLTRDHLPDAIAPFVFDTSERLGVDPASTALCAIIACSSVINDDWKIQPKQEDYKWTESARLWGLLLGGVSMKKSPTIRACTNPIDKRDAKARTQHDEDMREHKRKHAEWKKRGGDDTPDDPEPKPPRLVRYLTESTTIEALSDILRNDAEAKQIAPAKKILVRQDEMSEFFANLDRYNAGGRGGGDRGAYLRLYNGGRWTTDRVIRGNFAVENWSACLLGGIQPEPIRRIAHETADDGMLQRMLYHVGTEEPDDGIDKKPDHRAYERYESIITYLAVLAPKKGINGRINPIVLHADARPYWDGHRQLLKGVTAMPDTSGRMKAALDKWPATFCRIALAFHMIEAADRAITSTAAGLQVMPVPDVLPPETARRTAAYMRDVLLPHLRRADELMFSTIQSEHAKWIAGYILARKLDQIQMRDIIQAYRPLRQPERAAERESVLTSLVITGWLDPILPSARNPAKPVTTWQVNPRVHLLYAERAEAEEKRRAEARKAIAAAAALLAPATKAKC